MILPSLSRLTFTVTPSFTALPRHIPLASFRRPETFAYPSASICDFAWSAVKARSVRFRPVVAASGGDEVGRPLAAVEFGVTVVEQGCSGATAEKQGFRGAFAE